MDLRAIFSVFPAGAGVIRTMAYIYAVTKGFPRRCGGDPYDLIEDDAVVTFSPQVRG